VTIGHPVVFDVEADLLIQAKGDRHIAFEVAIEHVGLQRPEVDLNRVDGGRLQSRLTRVVVGLSGVEDQLDERVSFEVDRRACR